MGAERFKKVFDQLVALARQSGLVKDRLRLKDATHVIANIAVPPVIKLIAQVRDRLLNDLECIDPESATGLRIAVESVRESTRAKAATEQSKAVRREHPAIERKLNEIAKNHRGRRARYWTRAKVAAQQYMTAFAVNAKRITKLSTEELRTVTA